MVTLPSETVSEMLAGLEGHLDRRIVESVGGQVAGHVGGLLGLGVEQRVDDGVDGRPSPSRALAGVTIFQTLPSRAKAILSGVWPGRSISKLVTSSGLMLAARRDLSRYPSTDGVVLLSLDVRTIDAQAAEGDDDDAEEDVGRAEVHGRLSV